VLFSIPGWFIQHSLTRVIVNQFQLRGVVRGRQ